MGLDDVPGDVRSISSFRSLLTFSSQQSGDTKPLPAMDQIYLIELLHTLNFILSKQDAEEQNSDLMFFGMNNSIFLVGSISLSVKFVSFSTTLHYNLFQRYVGRIRFITQIIWQGSSLHFLKKNHTSENIDESELYKIIIKLIICSIASSKLLAKQYP